MDFVIKVHTALGFDNEMFFSASSFKHAEILLFKQILISPTTYTCFKRDNIIYFQARSDRDYLYGSLSEQNGCVAKLANAQDLGSCEKS